MNKVKFLTLLSISLIVINIALIFCFVFKKPNHERGEGPKKIIIEKLNFDETQIKEYEKLITSHRSQIHKQENNLFKIKDKLYLTLLNNDSLGIKDSLINQIAISQKQIENIHYKHFCDIKAICKPTQLKQFEDLSLELTNLFSKKRSK